MSFRRGVAGALCWAAALPLVVAPSVAAQQAVPGSGESSPHAAEATQPEAGAELLVGPGDLLSVEVAGLTELNRKVRVAADSTIKLPLVGALDVRGLSPRGVEELVAFALRTKNLVKDADVTVVVEEYVSQGVALTGAVGAPGTYQVAGGKTLFDLLLEAGGVKGGAREIVIIRQQPTGEAERIRVDARKLLVEGDLSYDLRLQAGDLVMVPEATQFTIFLSGSVARQGPVDFPVGEKLTLLQALMAAGGSSERAKLGKVKILRRLPDGTFQVNVVNLKRVRQGLDPDFELVENDIVVVGERFF